MQDIKPFSIWLIGYYTIVTRQTVVFHAFILPLLVRSNQIGRKQITYIISLKLQIVHWKTKQNNTKTATLHINYTSTEFQKETIQASNIICFRVKHLTQNANNSNHVTAKKRSKITLSSSDFTPSNFYVCKFELFVRTQF